MVEKIEVLNLIINGLPSISMYLYLVKVMKISFKPYYKWITFNMEIKKNPPKNINSFKPYYKWITFNILKENMSEKGFEVLNLIINGLPSI